MKRHLGIVLMLIVATAARGRNTGHIYCDNKGGQRHGTRGEKDH